MTIEEHATEFVGLPVREYDPDEGIVDPEGAAQRLAVDYDASENGATLTALLSKFVEDPGAARVKALIIGAWENVYDSSNDTERIVEALFTSSPKLAGLKGLFLGDVTREESEISWIAQSDVTALLDAYPGLEEFRVRGGSGLVIGSLRHANLRKIVVETGGLDGAVVRGLASSDLPALEHLELWVGSDGYGKTVTLDDLGPILRGEVFPALKYLGLRNYEGADEMAAAVAVAPILSRLKVLDLSLGDLGDDGAKALLAGPAVAGLEKLVIRHHYVSEVLVKKLEALGIEVDASEPVEPDKYGGESHRYIAVSE